MSTFEMKKKLKAEIAAAKKAGKSMQTVGKLQYKLNQISKDSKGTPVKSKTGVVKSKTGVVRQKAGKKKAGPDMYKDAVALDKPKSNVTVTPYKTAKITKGPQSGTAVNVLKGRPKNKPYVSTNPQVVKNLAAAKKKEDAQKKRQAALRKLSTDKKVKQRQKDYRNNKTSPY